MRAEICLPCSLFIFNTQFMRSAQELAGNVWVTQGSGASHSRVLWSFMTSMLVMRRGRKVGEEQATDSNEEIRMAASCSTKKKTTGALRIWPGLFQSKMMARWEAEASGSLSPAMWLFHVCLVTISAVPCPNGVQRMRIHSIPKERLSGHLAARRVKSWWTKCWNFTGLHSSSHSPPLSSLFPDLISVLTSMSPPIQWEPNDH